MRSVSTCAATSTNCKLPIKSHSKLFKSLGALLILMLFVSAFSAPAYAAVLEGVGCIVDQPAYSPATVNCTAGDLGLSTPVVTPVKLCNFPGDTAILSVVVDITTTSQTRYDMGLWFSIDGDPNGDGSATGLCTVVTIPNSLLDTNGASVNIDGNSCGDVQNTGNLVDINDADLGTFSLPCLDADGDGKIDVPLIVAYKNGTGSCSGPLEAVPQTKSKCSQVLNAFIDVPVPGRIIVTKDTVPDATLLFDFTFTGPTFIPVPSGGFDGSEAFQLADGDSFDTASFTGGLTPGIYDLQETPDAAYTSSISCDSDVDGAVADPTAIDLGAGETVTCLVTNSLNGFVSIVKRSIGAPRTPGDNVDEFFFTFPERSDFSIITVADGSGDVTASKSILALADETFTITEIGKPGWDLTDLSCVGGSTSISGNTVTINVVAGDTITCTFVNTERGEIIIAKTTDPVSTNTFSFSHDATGAVVPASPFDVDAGTPEFFLDVVPGTITVIETDPVPLGYELFSIDCIDDNPSGTTSTSDVGTRTATIELDPGESVRCTFVNNQFATVTLQKEWVGGVAGDVSLLGIDGTNGPQANVSTATGGDEIDTVDRAVMTAFVGETIDLTEGLGFTNVGNYTASFACNATNDPTYTSGATSATLLIDAADSAITCTYTNSIQTAALTLQKTWVGGVAGDMTDLDVTGINGTQVAPAIAPGGDATSPETAALTALVGETVDLSEVLGVGNVGDYTTSFACTGAANAPTYTPGATSATLLIGAADTAITCTYTNSIQLTQLQLAKTWSGALAGDAITAATTGLTNNASVASTSTGDNTDTGTPTQVFSGETATLAAEMFTTGDAANYTTSDWVCDDAAGSTVATGGTLSITDADLGNTITCTVTNTIVATRLQLAKAWSGALAGDAITADTTGLTNNASVASTSTGDNTDTGTAVLVTVGETATLVAEVFTTGDAANYTTSDWVCDDAAGSTVAAGGTLDIAAGDAGNTITCTVTNTIVRTQLQLTKTWAGALNGDAITADTTGLTNNASLTSTSTGDNTETGTAVLVTVGETATLAAEVFTTGDAANYTTSDWVCDDAAASTVAAGGTLDIAAGDAGNTITCTVTNTIVETQLQLAKTWSGAISGDAITADTTGLTNNASLTSTSTGDNTETGTAVLVTVGETATLAAEVFTTGDAANYTVSDWVCDDAAGSTVAAGGTLDIAAGDVGNTITCTVTNTLAVVPPVIVEPIAVPVNDKLALLLLTLMMLATGWYFRPATVRKF